MFEVKKAWIKIVKDNKVSFKNTKYSFASLDQIQEKLAPILEQQKLLILHGVDEWMVVTTIHDIDSGEQLSSNINLREGTKPQDKWSEITYYRRYNLVCLFDLEVWDDDGKPPKTKKEFFTDSMRDAIDAIDSIDELVSYYKENKGKWKEFVAYISARKQIINGDS
jgi:hypothetical protein